MAILSTNIIASATFTADGYSYTVDVEEVGASADTNDVAIISPITMRCGDTNFAPLEPILPRTLQFRMRDAAKYLQGQFASAGANKHLLNVDRGSTTVFRGYIDTRFQQYLAWHENPDFVVTAFDGLALLQGYPWLRSGYETLRETLFAILDLTGLGLPTNIVMPWKHSGADTSTEPPDALRWRSEDIMPEGSTYYDALRMLCEAFNAQCFQRDGEWWFVQRAERGSIMTVYPTDNTGSAGTATTLDPDYVATNENLLRASTLVIEHPSTSLVTIEQEWIDRGLRNGGFELLNARYWTVSGGALAGLTGGWTMDANGEYIEQEVGHTLMAISGTRDKLVIHLDFSMEVDALASGTGTVGNAFLDYLEVKLIEADGTVLYDDGATGGSNAWQSGQTYVQYPFLLAASAGTTVSETDLKWTTPAIPSSPCKIVVKFIFQSNPNSDGDYINSFTVNRAWVYHARPDEEDDIERPEVFRYIQGNTQGGEHLEQSFILGDMYDRHITPGVMEYYDGTDWEFTQDWNGESQKFHKRRLDDIVAQLGARLPGYAFGHLWGEDVDILSSPSYHPTGGQPRSVYVPVFEERIIHPVGKHSVRTAGYQLLGAERYEGAVFMGLSNNGETDDTTTGIYSVDINFNMASFALEMATASRPRVIVPINSRRELLYQLDGDLSKIYLVSMDTFSSPTEWLDVSPDTVQGIAINETDGEIVVTIDDSATALNDRLNIYDYDGVLQRGSSNPPVSVETGCLGLDPVNRYIYMRHNPGVRSVSRFHMDTLAYVNAEAVHVYGGMGPVEYNSVDGKLYWYEGQSGYLNIHVKTPSGNQTGSEVVLYNPVNAFTQMYYSKLHGELLLGSGNVLRLPPTGAGVSGTPVLTGLDISPLCAGICVYEPLGGHTAP